MLIDFKAIEPDAVKNFHGGEKDTVRQMFADENNRIMIVTLVPGASIGLHTHEPTSEIAYVLAGKGKAVNKDGTQEELLPGTCHYCPKGDGHSVINDGEETLVLFAVVPTHPDNMK